MDPPRSDPLDLAREANSGYWLRSWPFAGCWREIFIRHKSALEEISCNMWSKGFSISGKKKTQTLCVHLGQRNRPFWIGNWLLWNSSTLYYLRQHLSWTEGWIVYVLLSRCSWEKWEAKFEQGSGELQRSWQI